MTVGYRSIVGKRFGIGPNGPIYEGIPVGLPVHGKGKFIYVHSGTDGIDGSSPDTALGTLDEAFAYCVANRGDTIVVLPGHSETVTGAAGIAADVAGVTVVGLGTYSNRPTFLMDAGTAVTCAVSAANVTFRNLWFKSGHSNVVTCFDITAAGCWIDGCDFTNNTTNEDFLTPIKVTSTTDNAGDGLKVTNCRWITGDADDLEFIEINGNLAGLLADNNLVTSAGTASPFILTAGTKILTGARISWNYHQCANTANDLFIDNGGTGNTGIVAYNLIGNLDVTAAQVIGAATGLQFFENYATSTSTESGDVAPAKDTPNS